MKVLGPLIFVGGLVVIGLILWAWGDSVSHSIMIYGYGFSLFSDNAAFYLEYHSSEVDFPFGIHRDGSGSDPESHLPGFEWDRSARGLDVVYRLPFPVLLGCAVVAWVGCLGWWLWRRRRTMTGGEG